MGDRVEDDLDAAKAKRAAESALRELASSPPQAEPDDALKTSIECMQHAEHLRQPPPPQAEPSAEEPKSEWPKWCKVLDETLTKYLRFDDAESPGVPFKPDGSPTKTHFVFASYKYIMDRTIRSAKLLPGEPEVVRKWREEHEEKPSEPMPEAGSDRIEWQNADLNNYMPQQTTPSEEEHEEKTIEPTMFHECDTCNAKPGSPRLCRGCLHNRNVIASLEAQLAECQADHADAERYRLIKKYVLDIQQPRNGHIKMSRNDVTDVYHRYGNTTDLDSAIDQFAAEIRGEEANG